jgi:hypothetical protein
MVESLGTVFLMPGDPIVGFYRRRERAENHPWIRRRLICSRASVTPRRHWRQQLKDPIRVRRPVEPGSKPGLLTNSLSQACEPGWCCLGHRYEDCGLKSSLLILLFFFVSGVLFGKTTTNEC